MAALQRRAVDWRAFDPLQRDAVLVPRIHAPEAPVHRVVAALGRILVAKNAETGPAFRRVAWRHPDLALAELLCLPVRVGKIPREGPGHLQVEALSLGDDAVGSR